MPDSFFTKSISIPRPVSDVFGWHEREGALARLLPPWEKIEMIEAQGGIRDGGTVKLKTHWGPFAFRWEVAHEDYVEDRRFRDVQRVGPFARWEHQHRFELTSASSSLLTDEIRYRLPGGAIGRWVAGRLVRKKLERMFGYRHSTTQADLEMAAGCGAVKRLKILITGASGMIGRALVPFLTTQGHEVWRLVRHEPAGPREIFWDPHAGRLDDVRLRGVEAVIHLAGENIAADRWTPARREAIRASRIESARLLAGALSKLRHRPFVFVSASAVGIYGDRGDEVLDETSERGAGFLADVCAAWEHEVANVAALDIRPVMLRFGLVLTPAGGALTALRGAVRLGAGARFGSGRQWVSWIGIDDLLGVIYHSLLDRRCEGPVNVVAPSPVTQAEFVRTLARVERRPAWGRVPAWLLRAGLGERSELLLASARVEPRKLQTADYRFRHPNLEGALRHVLGRSL